MVQLFILYTYMYIPADMTAINFATFSWLLDRHVCSPLFVYMKAEKISVKETNISNMCVTCLLYALIIPYSF